MQFGFTVIKTENFAVLVLMVAYSLAKAKEGVRISYTALILNLTIWKNVCVADMKLSLEVILC